MNRAAGVTFAVWLLFIGACTAIVTTSRFSTDLEAFLPGAPTPAQQLLVDQLRDGVVSRMVLIAIEGDDEEVLAGLSRKLTENLATDPAFSYINNGSHDRFEADGAFLLAHRYLLSPAVEQERFSAETLRRALQAQLDLLSSSMGALTVNFLGVDPTGEFLSIVEKYQSENRPQVRHGVWFNSSGTRALLMAQTVAPGFEIDAQQTAVARIEAAFDEAVAAAGATDAVLTAVGPGVFAVQIRDSIKADAIRVTSLASLAIAGLLLFVLRSFRALGLVFLPVATGALAGVAAVTLAFGEIHGITLGFGATLIGESVDYSIHLLTGSVYGQRPEKTLSRIWPTLRLGVLTSIAGSAALLFSGFPGLAQLGMFSIAGLVVALAVTRWVVPLLLPHEFSVDLAGRFAPILLLAVERARILRVPSLLVIGGCLVWLVFEGGASWNDDFGSLNPIPASTKAFDREIRTELGAPDVRTLVVVRGVDQEATLQTAEAVGRTLDALVGEGALAGYESPAFYLPSQATQRARQDAIPQAAVLRENLERALEGLPFKRGLFDEFIDQAQQAKQSKLLTRNDLASTALASQVDSLLMKTRSTWYAVLPLLDVVRSADVAAALSRFDPQQVMLMDLKSETDALYQGYRLRILTYAVIGAVAIVMLLLAALRSVRRCVAVVLPIAAALVVTIAVLAAAGAELTMFHLVAMLLVVGVGSNYTLFFDRAIAQENDRGRTYLALAVCNLSTVLGFGFIALASTPVLKAIGITVAAGAALSLLFGAVFMQRDRSTGQPSSPARQGAPGEPRQS